MTSHVINHRTKVLHVVSEDVLLRRANGSRGNNLFIEKELYRWMTQLINIIKYDDLFTQYRANLANVYCNNLFHLGY